jgi:hypothetical protein
MIRNYYTDSFKSGIIPIVSTTQLIDGTVKSPVIIADNNTPVNTVTSVTLILTAVNRNIVRSMYITAPANGGTPAWTINDGIIVESVSHQATTTTITINIPKALVAGTTLTFFTINQSSWKEYNLFIGTVPSPITIQNNIAVTGGQILTLNTPDPRIQAGMTVGGIGIPAGITITTIAADGITLTVAGAAIGTLAANALLTYSFSVLPSITVLTINNQTVTFTNPAEGFVLPISVVQITGLAGGLTNIIAVN